MIMNKAKPEGSQGLDKTHVDPPPDSQQKARAGLRTESSPPNGPGRAFFESRRSRTVSRRLSPESAPVAKLLIFDEGTDHQGEIVRLRKEKSCVGRVEGELILPHDADLSARHFQIERIATPAGSRSGEPTFEWTLRDLQSTNGTFVRMRQVRLDQEAELRLGRGHYLWSFRTQEAEGRGRERRLPVLESLLHLDRRWEFPLRQRQTLGHASADVSIRLDEDPCLDDHHATLEPGPEGQWILTDHHSTNGVWNRVTELVLEDGTEILAGGQRFRFNV